ncbi:MAG TPA: alpha/beta hydrolase-fold protein [Planctomycetota bacterium]|nr:alpha/beta hydrolase-fold protein [Planctomycetota bacterium]
MHLWFRRVVFLAALATASSVFAQGPPPATVDTLVCRYFAATTDEARAAVVKALEQRRDITIGDVEDAVRRGVFYTPQPGGTHTREITVEFDGSRTDCTFWVPSGYDPTKSYPALVIMHGTGGTGQAFLSRWLPYVQNRDMILIAPTGVTGVDKIDGKPFGKGHGYGTHEIERSVPVSALHAARRLYNIDSDRVYITGVSMGGHAAWDSILTHPDVFAGAIPEAGTPIVEGFQLAKYMFLKNLFQARMWVMQGTPDKDQPQINAEATGRLKTMGYAVEYRQYDGSGHGAYRADSDKALDFVLAGQRDVYCKKIVRVVHRLVHGRTYWVTLNQIRGNEWDPRRRINIKIKDPIPNNELLKRAENRIDQQLMHLDAEVLAGNQIKIKATKVKELTVFLHDKLVDMDKPVVIRVNRQSAKTFRHVKRDVGVLLEEVRKDYDTRRIFYNSVTLKVY